METGWSELAPDPVDDTPPYPQLARNLASAIHAGAWRAGEALPSERLLSVSVGASRITARRAFALPAAVVPNPQALGASLYEYLDARGMTVVRALQHFRAANATHEIAKRMAVRPGSALLVITRLGYGADQRATEVTETYCRDDYHDFVAELKR